jgi:hypothetical protein
MQKSGIAVNHSTLSEEKVDMDHLEDFIVEGMD